MRPTVSHYAGIVLAGLVFTCVLQAAPVKPWQPLLESSSAKAWRGWESADLPKGWQVSGGVLSKDGNVDETDEGQDEDKDGEVDEANEHEDACNEADDETETEAEEAADASDDDETEAGEDAADPAAETEEPDTEVGGVGSVGGVRGRLQERWRSRRRRR